MSSPVFQSLLFAASIVRPSFYRCFNRVLLTLLTTAAEQYDDRIAVLAKIDPVSRAKVDLPLEYAGAHTLYRREVAFREPVKGSRDLRSRRCIQAIEPLCMGRATLQVKVFEDLNGWHL